MLRKNKSTIAHVYGGLLHNSLKLCYREGLVTWRNASEVMRNKKAGYEVVDTVCLLLSLYVHAQTYTYNMQEKRLEKIMPVH